jgi:hypothetical protein
VNSASESGKRHCYILIATGERIQDIIEIYGSHLNSAPVDNEAHGVQCIG